MPRFPCFAAAVAIVICATRVTLADVTTSHGLSAYNDHRYPADFQHFDYVNPDAPKGGSMSTYWLGTFDSLNAYIRKGNRAQPQFLALLHDTLMVRAFDEPDAQYGLLAAAVRLPSDRSWVEFDLRPEARFVDGSPVTAPDVVFSLDVLKEKGAPLWQLRLSNVESAHVVSARTVRFEFATGSATRGLPLEVAQIPIFAAADWEGKDFAESSLEAPLGSGPYMAGEVEAGRRLVLVRRPDYWAAELPVNRGRYNFDRLELEYFRDHSPAFEAFKAGVYAFREEYVSKVWATQYDFPAVADGRVRKETVPDLRPSGTQGFWINTRRARFADARVREALDLAFDFEWSNRTLFYDQYVRTDSFFEGSPMEAIGSASEAEQEVLDAAGAELPATDLAQAYIPPVTDGSGRLRDHIRRAGKLLEAAGWTVQDDGVRRNAAGERLTLEILTASDSFERIVQPYVANLQRIGVAAELVKVDPAQYQSRRKTFEYDMLTERFSLPETPGDELSAFFRSTSVDAEGSYNLAGVSDPAIDRLLDAVVAAQTRAELAVAVQALDRTLRAGHYWVPHWTLPAHRIAYWDRFGRPATKPPYDPAFIDTWWEDPERAAALEQQQQ